MNYQA